MEAGGDAAERELIEGLAARDELFSDDDFCHQLYRALASNVWTKDGLEAELALSWSRAEEVVNDLRARFTHDPLVLAQTGGEGEISALMESELGGLGWTARPLDTGRDEPSHVDRAQSPPDAGGEPPEWERQAHREADENRLRRG